MSPRLLALLLCLAPAGVLSAQGWIDIERPRIQGPSSVVRVSSTVRAVIDGRVARFEVHERFRNSGAGIAEGTYHYPLPGEAAFSDFSLFQGEQELKGEMMASAQARSIYEDIVRRRKDPALITLVGHGLIRAQVFPIQPGETRTVILRYTQLLGRDGDALRLRYSAGDRGDAPVTFAAEIHRPTTLRRRIPLPIRSRTPGATERSGSPSLRRFAAISTWCFPSAAGSSAELC